VAALKSWRFLLWGNRGGIGAKGGDSFAVKEESTV
jgi:hypothetical protein